jgi:hypothetical protein
MPAPQNHFLQDYFLRWRIRARIRRFLRPSFRRPRPVFFVPKTHAPCAIYRDRFPPIGNRTVYPEPGPIDKPGRSSVRGQIYERDRRLAAIYLRTQQRMIPTATSAKTDSSPARGSGTGPAATAELAEAPKFPTHRA